MKGWIIYIIFVNAMIAFKLWWDTRAKNNGRIINHGKSVMFDGLLYVISALGLIYWMDGYEIWWSIFAILAAASWRWIWFDAIFAKINWGVWEKYGTSSKLDVLLSRLKKAIGKLHHLIKLLPALIGIILVIIWKSLNSARSQRRD